MAAEGRIFDGLLRRSAEAGKTSAEAEETSGEIRERLADRKREPENGGVENGKGSRTAGG